MVVNHKTTYWDVNNNAPNINIDLLCVDGAFLRFKVNSSDSIGTIKETALGILQNRSSFKRSLNIKDYYLECIRSDGQVEKLFDDSRILNSVDIYSNMMRLKLNSNQAESTVNAQDIINEISMIPDVMKRLDLHDEEEIGLFRSKFSKMSLEIEKKRQRSQRAFKMAYQYPPDVDDDSFSFPSYLSTRKNKVLRIKFIHQEVERILDVQPMNTPAEILKYLADKFNKLQPELYVLKIAGQDNYLIPGWDHQTQQQINYPLVGYRPIRQSVCLGNIPVVCVVSLSSIHLDGYMEKPSIKEKAWNNRRMFQELNILTVPKSEMFTLTLDNILIKNRDSDTALALEAALYCDYDIISPPLIITCENNQSFIYKSLPFDISLSELPRSTKICFGLYQLIGSKTSSKRSNMILTHWANVMVFTSAGYLKEGTVKVKMWPNYTSDRDSLNPSGVIYNCLEPDVPEIELKFPLTKASFYYPKPSDMPISRSPVKEKVRTNEWKALIDNLSIGDIMYELSDKDQEILWSQRDHIKDSYHEFLPELLKCFTWKKKENQIIIYSLLHSWRPLSSANALRLLGSDYLDVEVRNFAVRSLENMSDIDLEEYLLQLVQALKFDLYLDSELTYFLIRRALLNHRIGHFLFWHLRSELENLEFYVKARLMLEAYCYGIGEYALNLHKQVMLLEKLKDLSLNMQIKYSLEERMNIVKKSFQQSLFDIKNTLNPLDPRFRMSEIIYEKIDVKQSKKKPVVMFFTNADPYGEEIKFLFKFGDDLRQDILTLQTIRTMNRIWKLKQMDNFMVPYRVLSSGNNVGLIELVENAKTLCKIQSEMGGMKKRTLYDWLQNCNDDPSKTPMSEVTRRFRLSCAGYSIATYVIGVGDRHNDNIMLKTNGQLFHIDFGHFLGNFKSFMGIKRERVPFVMTKDMMYACTEDNQNHMNAFIELCHNSYQALRENCQIILTLFLMMTSSGIPQLTKPEDINYIRRELCLMKDDKQSRLHLNEKIKTSIQNNWSTYLNFMAHNYRVN